MKVTNNIGLWDSELGWYSLSAIHWICFSSLEHGLRIHAFRLTWPCQIIEVLATRAEFFQLSGYWSMINFAFTFRTTNDFGVLCDGVMTQFKLVEHKLLNYGHLPLITKTIQVRRTRHAGHCWRSRDELISDVLLWTPTHGRAKAGQPARTYIQQLCEDTGYGPEDLPEAMNDREKWRERVMDIRACGTTWWWWWWYIHLYNFQITRTAKQYTTCQRTNYHDTTNQSRC